MAAVTAQNNGSPTSKNLGKSFLKLTKAVSTKKLYGRQSEREELAECWEACCHDKCQHVVVLSGAAGTGKAALANSVRPLVKNHPHRGSNQKSFFISGKFPETNSSGPFEVFTAAFSGYLGQLFDCGDQELISECKQQVRKAVKKDRDILVEMIPSLEQILIPSARRSTNDSSRSLHTQLYGSEAANRLRNAFSRAVAALCACTPILLFLDDVQWAESPSLDLLRSLIQCEHKMPLFVILAIVPPQPKLLQKGPSTKTLPLERDLPTSTISSKMRDRKKPFKALIEDFRADDSVNIKTMDLSNLGLENIQLIIAEALGRPPSDVLELAQMAHDETKGNAFHLFQLLRFLIERKVITREGNNHQWTWDDAELRDGIASADSILDLVVHSIQLLPQPVQQMLKVASCLSVEIDGSAIDLVMQAPSADLLQQASDEGFLTFYPQYGGYRFSHVWIRQASYSLIAKEEIADFHWTIGNRLLQGSNMAALEDNIMLIASLLNMGFDMITDESERYEMAHLNLRAARKAMLLPSFPDAAVLLRKGIEWLGQDPWNDRYQLTLDLYSCASTIETSNGNHEVVATCINEVVQHGATLEDKLDAYVALLRSMMVQDDMMEATSTCLNVLQQLGERVPKASKFTVWREFVRVRSALRGKSDDELLDLPAATDPRHIQVLRFLYQGSMSSWRSKSPVFTLFALRSVLLSVRRGMHETTALAFVVFAMTLCGLHIDVKEGYRFAKLSMAIAERSNSAEIIVRVHFLMGTGVLHWTRPVQESLDALDYGDRVGMETGYVGIALMCRVVKGAFMHATGHKLSLVKKYSKETARTLRLYRQGSTGIPLRLVMQLIQCYEGHTDNPSRLKGTITDFDQSLQESLTSHDQVTVVAHYYYAMELAYIHGDFEEAARMAAGLADNLMGSSPALTASMMQFELALVAIALCREGISRSRNKKLALKHFKAVSRWAIDSPSTYKHLSLFLEAEITAFLSSKGKTEKVCSLYTSARELAQEHGNLMVTALIYERMGDYLAAQGQTKDAALQWRDSAEVYEEWGALVKCRQLRQKVAQQHTR